MAALPRDVHVKTDYLDFKMSKDLYLNLYGGLGNQLFQYISLLVFKDRILSCQPEAIVKYHLNKNVLNFKHYRHKSNLSDIIHGLDYENNAQCFLRFARIIHKKNYINDLNFSVSHNFKSKKFYFDGYFQDALSQSEFDCSLQELKRLIKLNYCKNAGIFKDCLIHIRGGDFIKLGWDDCNNSNYYKSAICKMREIGVEKFFVVSDDNSYASKLINELDGVFELIGSDFLSDFELIGRFKHRILSSSTFSFWASAVSFVADAVVIAPEYWSPNRIRKLKLPGEIDY